MRPSWPVCATMQRSYSIRRSAVEARLSRDNLDENGGGNLEIEAAAGSGAMIIWGSKLRKHSFSTSLVDCR
jgi:hypothetical protein